MTGDVLVGDRPVGKPGAEVPADAEVRLRGGDSPYVSRGGEKLAGALDAFGLAVRDLVALDVGASTGGFTDCLLERGARRVIALDVGYGQLAWKLRQDSRVVVIERTNARRLTPAMLPEAPELAVVDVSFISLATVLPAIAGMLTPGGTIVALVKPQFEVGRGRVGKGGVVRDPALRAEGKPRGIRLARAFLGPLRWTWTGDDQGIRCSGCRDHLAGAHRRRLPAALRVRRRANRWSRRRSRDRRANLGRSGRRGVATGFHPDGRRGRVPRCAGDAHRPAGPLRVAEEIGHLPPPILVDTRADAPGLQAGICALRGQPEWSSGMPAPGHTATTAEGR